MGSRDQDLKTDFDQQLSQSDDSLLDRLRATIVEHLGKASGTYRHPWHLGAMVTAGSAEPQTGPQARMMVVQQVDRDPLALRCHTDRRAGKVERVRQSPQVEWLFYQSESRIQLRLSGQAQVITSGPIWESAWKDMGVNSRRCYLAPLAPGQNIAQPDHNLPEGLGSQQPTWAASESGKVNFAIILTHVDAMDWMYLKHDGHLRCGFQLLDKQHWQATWRAP